MTSVRIKTKGQFFGKVGKVAKILNQHQVVVQFEGIKGLFTFSHRALQIVEANELHAETLNIAQIESEAVYKAFMEVINELAAESKTLEQYQNVAAVHYVKGITLAIQHISQKIAFKNYEPC